MTDLEIIMQMLDEIAITQARIIFMERISLLALGFIIGFIVASSRRK